MKLHQGTKNIFSFLFRFCFSAFLLIFLFSKIDTQKTAEVLKSAHLGYLFYALLVFLLVYVILLCRWVVFVKALDLAAPLRDVVRYHFIALFGNLFLPTAIGGDLIKIVGLCKNSAQKTKVIASVLLDRLSGFASIMIVSIIFFIPGYRFFEDNTLLGLIGLVTVFSFGLAAVLFNEKIYGFGCRIFNKLPKVKEKLMDVHYDVALLRGKRKEGLKAIGLACLAQVVHALSWFLVAKALYQDIGILYFLIFVPLTCIASSFPSIGGLGARDLGAVYLFSKVGMESGIALSMSLINFLFMVIGGLIGGGIYVFTLSSGRVQYHSSDASALGGHGEA